MYELKKTGKVFRSKFVGTGSSSYEKIIYRAAVSQRLKNNESDKYRDGTKRTNFKAVEACTVLA